MVPECGPRARCLFLDSVGLGPCFLEPVTVDEASLRCG